MASKRKPDVAPSPIIIPPGVSDPAAAARERKRYERMRLVELLGQSGTRPVQKVIEDTKLLEAFIAELDSKETPDA